MHELEDILTDLEIKSVGIEFQVKKTHTVYRRKHKIVVAVCVDTV